MGRTSENPFKAKFRERFFYVSRVGKGKKRAEVSRDPGPNDAATSYRLVIVLVIIAAAAVMMVMAAAVVMMALSMGSLLPLATVLETMETMTTGSERHAPERHRQRQHERREQYRNTLFHCFHLLSFYPRRHETGQMMGEALVSYDYV
jgi:hypothetical protein